MNSFLEDKIEVIKSKYGITYFDEEYMSDLIGGQRSSVSARLVRIHEALYGEKTQNVLEGQLSISDLIEDWDKDVEKGWLFPAQYYVIGAAEYGPERIKFIEELYGKIKEEILRAKETNIYDYAGAVLLMNTVVANILAELGEVYNFVVFVRNNRYFIESFAKEEIRIHGVRFDEVLQTVNNMQLEASSEYIKTIDRFIKAVTGLEYYSDDYELFCKSYEGSDEDRREFVETVIRNFGELLENTTTEAIEKEREKRIQSERFDSIMESTDLLHKEHEKQNEKLLVIEEKLDLISSKINGIQSMTEDLLAKAESFEEKEKIYASCADSCVDTVLKEYDEDSSSDVYVSEKEYLKKLFGDIWDKKIDSLSRVCLHTSKVMFKQAQLIDKARELEYSGICLLMVKALEIEMKKRFYDGFLEYLQKNEYELNDYPSYLVFTDKYHNTKIKRENYFTLGNIPFIFAFREDVNNRQQGMKDNEILYKYVSDELIKGKDTSEIASILKDYGMRIDKIVNDYRNQSAHRGSISYDKVTECFKIIVDEIQLLKKMLDTFEK